MSKLGFLAVGPKLYRDAGRGKGGRFLRFEVTRGAPKGKLIGEVFFEIYNFNLILFTRCFI